MAGQILGAHKTSMHSFFAEGIAFLADADGIVSQVSAEGFLDDEDRTERLDIDILKNAQKSPADALARHAKRFVDLFPIRAAQHHSAWVIRLQLDPEVL